MPDYFPALLDLRGRRCLVVGGGEIAERKVRALADCGARAVVVSPAATQGIVALAEAGLVIHCRRPFRKSDARRCAVVIAATGHADVDAAVARAARERRALVNVVDRPAECDFIFPSVLRRGELQIAVSTGGKSRRSPARSAVSSSRSSAPSTGISSSAWPGNGLEREPRRRRPERGSTRASASWRPRWPRSA